MKMDVFLFNLWQLCPIFGAKYMNAYLGLNFELGLVSYNSS